ncbi:MAG: S-layer homology domain-containing protein, partial [Clostridia bacterium]|nr:S-layer homology domain-containing protein [Clostridia bacterium]
MKKTISLILCVLMLVSAFSTGLTAYAQETAELFEESTVSVTFVGDVTGLPAVLKVTPGTEIDITDYYDGVASNVAGLNFNGWSTTGKFEDLIVKKFKVEKNTTLYAEVSSNINFAVQARGTGMNSWGVHNGSAEIDDEKQGLVVTATGSAPYVYRSSKPYSIPAAKYARAYVYVDAEYGSDTLNFSKVGNSLQYFFFSPDTNYSRAVTGTVIGIIENQGRKIAVVECPLYSSSSWAGTIGGFRIDAWEEQGDWIIYGVQFAEAEPFDATVIPITELDAPKTGAEPSTYALCANEEIGRVQSVTWAPTMPTGVFEEGTKYTATITVAPKEKTGMVFASDIGATVNGNEASCFVDTATALATVTYTFPATENYVSFTMEITGPKEIAKAARATQYKANFYSTKDVPNKDVIWSVEAVTGGASIEEDGRLIPQKNGTVKVIATSVYNPKVKTSYEVNIINQAKAGTLRYRPGTTAKVSNLPAAQKNVSGLVTLSKQIPTRAGYIFYGWATSDESVDVVDEVNVNGDTEVFAVWVKGIEYGFNGALDSPWDVEEGTFTYYDDYIQMATGNGTNAATTAWGGLDDADTTASGIDTTAYTQVVVRFAADKASQMKFYYQNVDTSWSEQRTLQYTYSPKGIPDPGDIESDKWITHTFDLASSSLWTYSGLTGIRAFVVTGVQQATACLDYIRLLDTTREIRFRSAEGKPTNMPDTMKVRFGDTVTITKEPELEGYQFIGWSKDEDDDGTGAKKNFLVTDDYILYAIWNEEVELNPTTEGGLIKNEIGDIDEGMAVLAKTTAGKDVPVTVSYNGGEKVATTNGYGFAVIEFDRDVEDAVISMSSNFEFVSIVVTAPEIANAKANEVKATGGANQEEPELKVYYGAETQVTNLRTAGQNVPEYSKPGPVPPGLAQGQVGEDASPKDKTRAGGDIIFNFNNDADKDFFGWYRQTKLEYKDGIAKIISAGYGNSDGISFNSVSNLEIDPKTHRYVIFYAKQEGYTNSQIRLYYRTDKAGLSEARTQNQLVGTDYSMVVFDFGNDPEWKDTITEFMVCATEDHTGILYIDWILITDTLPDEQSIGLAAGAKFMVVNKNAAPFTDLEDGAWYVNDVKNAYMYGLVSGTSDTTFEPNGNVTIAEAIAFAVKLNYAYLSKSTSSLGKGANWYDGFVQAAIKAKIIGYNEYSAEDYDKVATRKQVAAMIAKALPKSWYEQKNLYEKVPDLDENDGEYKNIKMLYDAGVLNGSDADYNFLPDTPIIRAEVAAIVVRAAKPDQRTRVITDFERESRRHTYSPEEIFEQVTLDSVRADKVENGLANYKALGADLIMYLTKLIGSQEALNISKIKVGIKVDGSKVPSGTPTIYFSIDGSALSEGNTLKATTYGKMQPDEDGI